MDEMPYRPAPQVVRHLHQTDFVAVVGPTAVGKTTIMKAATARESALHLLVPGVSREPRQGERHDIDYHFGVRTDMAERAAAGGYVTVVVGASGDLYTTAPEDYPAGKTIMMAVMAHAMPMFRARPFHTFRTIFMVPPDYATWQARLRQHHFGPAELRQRLVEAERSLVFGLEDESTHFVLNKTIDLAAADLTILALGRPAPPRLQADQSRARELVADMLERLRRSVAGL